jgi:hypothetical protein
MPRDNLRRNTMRRSLKRRNNWTLVAKEETISMIGVTMITKKLLH